MGGQREGFEVGHRACSWCAKDVPIMCRPGRPRLYCNHACRQRAYEHRHGFTHERTQRALPGQVDDNRRQALRPTDGTGYERGGLGMVGDKVHALRPSVRPEGRRRETLCGALARPVFGHSFLRSHPQSCTSCGEIADRHPLRIAIEPSNELARLRALIEETTEHRLQPDIAIRWLRDDGIASAR